MYRSRRKPGWLEALYYCGESTVIVLVGAVVAEIVDSLSPDFVHTCATRKEVIQPTTGITVACEIFIQS